MKIGLALQINDDLKDSVQRAKQLGIDDIQLQVWNMSLLTAEHAKQTETILADAEVRCTSFWAGWHGPISWTFDAGPSVLGIVPVAYRASRVQNILDGAKYAKRLGIDDIVTHIGFVPLNCNDSDYLGVVQAVRYIASELKKTNQSFLLETGHEPPVVLRRLIEDCKVDNIFINYDPANLMKYGSSNAIGGIDLLGEWIRSAHVKDATYPTSGYQKGVELPIGAGSIDYPDFVGRLKAIGFNGMLYIEHELNVPKEVKWKQIKEGKEILERALTSIIE